MLYRRFFTIIILKKISHCTVSLTALTTGDVVYLDPSLFR
nr:MAG TPA: hypothetical protein [Bacteriophage sp.]